MRCLPPWRTCATPSTKSWCSTCSDEQTEQRFDFADRPTTFIDLESGEEVRANPAEVREAYVSKMSSLRRDLDVRCGSAGIDWVEVDIAKGVNPVLTAYLLKRQKMR